MNGINYRDVRFCHNVELFGPLESTPENGIPILKPERWVPVEFIPFNFAKTCKDRSGKGIHFFLDDYQFERAWNKAPETISLLSEFDAVMSPDFSTYVDWPVPVQRWNHYRKHCVGAYLQQKLGITVYPSISWSDEASFDWCFEGEPVGGCVAISSVGTQRNPDYKRGFLYGYDAMLERLQPETIIFHGKVPEECRGTIVRVKSFQDKFREATVDPFDFVDEKR